MPVRLYYSYLIVSSSLLVSQDGLELTGVSRSFGFDVHCFQNAILVGWYSGPMCGTSILLLLPPWNMLTPANTVQGCLAFYVTALYIATIVPTLQGPYPLLYRSGRILFSPILCQSFSLRPLIYCLYLQMHEILYIFAKSLQS